MKYEKPFLIFILVAALIIRLGVLNRAGEMFDEIAVVRNGEIYWGGIKNLNFSNDIWRINYEHPPVAKYIFGLGGTIERNIPWIGRIFDADFHPDKGYFLARLFSALIGIATIFMVYVTGRKWFGVSTGLFGAGFLAFMPHFISHNAVAGLETPQALFSVLLVFFYMDGFIGEAKINYKKILLSFISFTLLFLTKFSGGLYIFFYLTILSVLIISRKVKFSSKIISIHLAGAFLSLLLIYVLWPWLWENPLKLLESIGYFSNAHSGEYFLGSIGQPSWYYYFIYFVGTTPPAILILGLFSLVRYIDRRNISDKNLMNHSLYFLSTFVWFLTPFTASFLGLKQDGIRYVFSYMPALSIMSGFGAYLIFKEFKSRLVQYLIVFLIFGSIAWSLVKFYPYYLDYYNIIFGGLSRVYDYGTFDYDWWGEGIKEAVLYVNKNYSDVSVLPLFHPAHTAPLFKDGITVYSVYDPLDEPDLILVSEYFQYYGWEFPFLVDYTQIGSIDVNKMPLVRIYSIR